MHIFISRYFSRMSSTIELQKLTFLLLPLNLKDFFSIEKQITIAMLVM